MQEVFPDSFSLCAKGGQIPAQSLAFSRIPTLSQTARAKNFFRNFQKGVDKVEKRWYDSKAVEKRQVFWKVAQRDFAKTFQKGLTSEKKCGRVDSDTSLRGAAGILEVKNFAEKIPKKA